MPLSLSLCLPVVCWVGRFVSSFIFCCTVLMPHKVCCSCYRSSCCWRPPPTPPPPPPHPSCARVAKWSDDECPKGKGHSKYWQIINTENWVSQSAGECQFKRKLCATSQWVTSPSWTTWDCRRMQPCTMTSACAYLWTMFNEDIVKIWLLKAQFLVGPGSAGEINRFF